MYDKDNFGINGIHANLGRQLSDAEFKGYMVATNQEREKQINEVKGDVKELKAYLNKLLEDGNRTHSLQDSRLISLENSRSQATGFIMGIGMLGGVLASVIIAIFLKWIGVG